MFKSFLPVAAFALLASQAAFADGFICNTVDGDLNVTVYNHVHAQLGTRTAAILILSDPNAAEGHRTIATFKDGEENLVSHSATFSATTIPSSEADRTIADPALGYLKSVTLEVYYDYNAPAPAGAKIGGELTLDSGVEGATVRQVECTRYLKSAN